MRKFFKITAAILVSLLIFFVAVFKYRQYQANQISIPGNVTAVLKVSVDEVLKTLAANMISNPGFYLKSSDNQKTSIKKNKLASGVQIPASIYFYAIQNQPATAVFSRFDLKSYPDFETFLTATLRLKISRRQQGINIATSSLGNVVICYNTEAAAMVVSGEVVNFDAVLIDVLKQNKFVKLQESRFNAIKASTHHIAYRDNKNSFSADFVTGAINFDADLSTPVIVPAANPKHSTFNNESTASIWMDAAFATTLNKTYRFKNTTIERDSLLKYYHGYMDFEWTNSTSQTDSIITYEYNDDFEKIEKVSLQKKEIPNFTINVAADAKGLRSYLSRQKMINLDSGTVDKSIFPLYKTFIGGNNQDLLLGTNSDLKINPRKETSKDFLALNVNFSKLNAQLNLPVASRYLKSLKRLALRGTAVRTNAIQLNGNLTFVNGDINALYQLLKDF